MGRLLALLKASVGRAFASLVVSGEVIDPLLSQRGHLYFRLTDGQAEIKAVMWRSEVERLKVQLEAGDQVTVRGSLDIYAPRGDLQLVATALMQSGRGQKMLALAQLKSKLKAEGLFDRPRLELPPFPRLVGVVTSLGSAVIHDIYQSVQKRFPCCQLILSPSAVSGEQAPAELILALERLRERVEVVIIARGGGSFEELLPFSDEKLVRMVADFPLPVVSAVGHGSDSTLLDLAADHTAPTPTAAAVLVTPEREELRAHLVLLKKRAERAISRSLHSERHRLQRARDLCRTYHPQRRLEGQRANLHGLSQSVRRQMLRQMQARREQLSNLQTRLHTLGPQTLLRRGFAMVYLGKSLVTRCEGRTQGEELELHFADGRILSKIERVELN